MATAAKRRKRADLKHLVLDAGYDLAVSQGLGAGLETITYASVFDYLERSSGVRVTRGSVHERIWDSQRDFQIEVLAKLAAWNFRGALDVAYEITGSIINNGDTSTHAGRHSIIRDMVRLGSYANLVKAEATDKWSLWHTSIISLLNIRENGEPVPEIQEAVRKTYRELAAEYGAFYLGNCRTIGLKVRSDFGVDDAVTAFQFGKAVNALADGFMTQLGTKGIEFFEMPTGPDGEMEEWDDFSFSLWCLVSGTVENPPD